MLNNGLFTSNTDLRATPQSFFDRLNEEFKFTLDPCATLENAKCKKFFTKEQDGLAQSRDNEIVFCNPPYGREIGKWVEKASKAKGGKVVMLLPARTDTRWFHNFIYKKSEIRFILLLNFGKMKFKVGDMVRITREGLAKQAEHSFVKSSEISGWEIKKIIGDKIYCPNNEYWYEEKYLELVPEEPEFEEGEMIEVSDDGKEWERRIFLYYIPNVPDKYLCVHKNYEGVYLQGGDRYDYQARLYARKLKPQLTRKEIAEKFGVREDFTLVD